MNVGIGVINFQKCNQCHKSLESRIALNVIVYFGRVITDVSMVIIDVSKKPSKGQGHLDWAVLEQLKIIWNIFINSE